MWDERNSSEDDLFSSIDGASVKGQRLPYLLPRDEKINGEPGLYIVEIDSIKVVTKREGNVKFYCAEFTIIESGVESRPSGMKASWMTKIASDMGPINIKRFLGALSGYADADVIDANVKGSDASLSVGELQPFTGCRALVQVRMIETKGNKQPFSEHRWEPVQGYTLGDILERREAAAQESAQVS